MFTDGPATPVRLEILIDVLANFSSGLKREDIYYMLQPPPLSEGSHNTAKEIVSTALQLELAEEKENVILLTQSYDRKKSVKENILEVADQKMLSNVDIELYLALYYAYYLGLNEEVYQRLKFSREKWADQFNKDVFKNEPQPNPFNRTKHTGLDRWLNYLGLGWYDYNNQFQANPYGRLFRTLPPIFDGNSKISGDQFMAQLAQVCPELDGGEIFLQANEYRGYTLDDKQCTLGLSHALIDLHEDKIIRLDCPVDSRGWNIGIAQPSRDDTIKSDRITNVEYLGN